MKEPHKILTIHLYRKEEALAALRWAIICKNYTESIFWGLELFDSDLMSDAIDILEKTWVSQIGYCINGWTIISDIIRLKEADEYSRDDFIHTLYSWSQVKTLDSTAFHLLIRGSTTSTEMIPQFQHSKEYMNITDSFIDCLKRGKLLEAWLFARALDTQEVWLILQTIFPGRNNELLNLRALSVSERERLASAFVLVSINEETWITANAIFHQRPIPQELKEKLEVWDSETSLRKRREFKVRPEAITYICARSTMQTSESTESDICENLEATLRQSPYWQSVLEDYQIDGDWKTDRYKEMFYNTYFPYAEDDIPDEWSSTDRDKSHGRGHGKTKVVALRQYINAIFQNSQSLGIWKSIKSVCDNLPPSLDWDTIYSTMQPACSDSLTIEFPLISLMKRFVLT
jgi:hypothetical protein